jgi:sensor histidine kinase regulating citrate/malate metabolism
MGILPKNLVKIFTFGFTTKEKGRGFGLHSSALAAKDLGGSLTVKSDGERSGSTFTLAIPIDQNLNLIGENDDATRQ